MNSHQLRVLRHGDFTGNLGVGCLKVIWASGGGIFWRERAFCAGRQHAVAGVHERGVVERRVVDGAVGGAFDGPRRRRGVGGVGGGSDADGHGGGRGRVVHGDGDGGRGRVRGRAAAAGVTRVHVAVVALWFKRSCGGRFARGRSSGRCGRIAGERWVEVGLWGRVGEGLIRTTSDGADRHPVVVQPAVVAASAPLRRTRCRRSTDDQTSLRR